MHKKTTEPGNQAVSCTCFNAPIVMVQNIDDPEPKKKYQKVHMSFQSTSPHNIQTINMLSCVSKFEETREQSIGKNKRKFDHFMTNCHMGYQCCKYWHSPKSHGKALVVVIAIDIYLEVAKGNMCGYRPLKKLYMEDENMLACVQQHKVRREKRGRPKT
eukprot:12783015-Ditylum_brightwellii.AAC.1